MNLFRFDDSWAFDTSPQIWIYVVAVVILMAMTFSAWVVFARYQKDKKNKKKVDAKLNPV
jgi:agmatine/peptidylarginine deiminase